MSFKREYPCYTTHRYAFIWYATQYIHITNATIWQKKCTPPAELSQLIKRNPFPTHKLIEMHFIHFVKYFLMLQ